MFSIVIAFIIGILAGVFGTTAAINKHREYIAGVTREFSGRLRKGSGSLTRNVRSLSGSGRMDLGRRGRDSVSSDQNTGLMTFLCANLTFAKFHKITHGGVSSGSPDENESHYRPVLSKLIVTACYHYTP